MNKVSIIIPIYNVEKYLEECIESVVHQTYKNIEIILVNDGSPDNSDEICKKYKKTYDNIKYIYQENQGVSVARNRGREEATGDYIYFLDSDDSLDKDFISTSMELVEKNDPDIVIVSTNVFLRKNAVNIDLCVTTAWKIIIKKEFMEQYPDIIFPLGLKNFEDSLFTYMLFCLTYKVVVNEKAIYNYRRHKGQISAVVYNDKNLSIKLLQEWLNIIENFYDKYKLWECRKNYLYVLLAKISTNYWYCHKLSKEDKIFYFNTLHNFVEKHNLHYFKLYNITFENFLANRFFKCRKWQEFEKYLFLYKFLRFIKHLFLNLLNFYK